MDSAFGLAKEMSTQLARQIEDGILDQLNDFVSRGLIVIEQSQPTFVQEADNAKIKILTSVRLRLKDREYIEQLEKELEEYRSIKRIIAGEKPPGGLENV